MLSEVTIGGFKSFGEPVSFRLAPLTILVGPNGVGKSSVLDAIGLMAQSSSLSSTGLVWAGRWVQFAAGRSSVQHRGISFNDLVLGVGLSRKGTDSLDQLGDGKGEISFCFSDKSKDLRLDGVSVARATLVTDESAKVVYFARLPGLPAHEVANFNTSFGGDYPDASALAAGANNPRPEIKEIGQAVLASFQFIRRCLFNRVYLIGAHRLPVRIATGVQQDPYVVGKDGANTLAALSLALRAGGLPAERIVFWAKEFGMPGIQSGWVNEPTLLADYLDPTSGEKIEAGMAGFGSQQILPVITQLFCAKPGSLVLIEEPEISLHPEAQVSLLRMLADAVSSGRQVMITTHSQTLLSALGELSTDSKLKPEDIAVFHLERGANGTMAKRLEVDPAWYIRGWVPSFAKVETQLLKGWISHVGEQIEAEG